MDANSAPRPPILVTGAARNIGLHLARRLLEDGHAVVAHYRSATSALDELTAAGAMLVQADMGDEAGIRALAGAVRERCSPLGGIVHNASAFAATPADTYLAAAAFRDYWTVHMLAPWLLTRLLESALTADSNQTADVVMISDIHADNPPPEYDIYSATKAGMQNLALAFAKRLAPAVKVNVIQPGAISFTGAHDAVSRARILAATPMGRSGSAEAVYAALRGVLDNPYLNGAIIPVDGGRRLGRY